MKLLIPMIITLISFPLSAQETPTPAKPQPTVKDPKPATNTPSVTPANSSRRVVLPPKATSKPSSRAPQPTPRPTSSSRASTRRVVLPPSSRPQPSTLTPNNRVSPRPTNTASGSARTPTVSTGRPAPPARLQENITIQLKGSTETGEALDLSLTGIGPVFQADVVIGENATILTHTYSVEPHGPNYLVEFSIGARIRFASSTNGTNTNYQFRDNSINGKVLLEPGKPVTISNNQGKVLTLTASKP